MGATCKNFGKIQSKTKKQVRNTKKKLIASQNMQNKIGLILQGIIWDEKLTAGNMRK